MAGKTGVNQGEWNSAVSKAENAVSSISEPKAKELGKTTLNRFKQLTEDQRQINQALTSFQSVSQTDTQKMKQVAENIVAEDKAAASSIEKNTVQVRF